MTRLYVGMIPRQATDADLQTAFGAYSVQSVEIVHDHFSGRPRGFAYIEIDGDAAAAVQALNDSVLLGHKIIVAVAP